MAGDGSGLGTTWATLVDEVMTGMRDWRSAHPAATFAEIETEVDQRLAVVRTRMLEETALASAARDRAATADGSPIACAACGGPLVARGRQERRLRVRGDHSVRLSRTYQTCATCGRGVFPPG